MDIELFENRKCVQLKLFVIESFISSCMQLCKLYSRFPEEAGILYFDATIMEDI